MGRRPDLAERNRRNATHGLTKSKTWRAWSSMKERCNNPRHRFYHRYGGRGINVCQRWNESFESFLDDMGKAPDGHTLDRIDNDGDYTPSNCRWATWRTQANNRSSSKFLVLNGERRTIAQWSRKVGLERKTLEYRIRAGWDVRKALLTPSTNPRKKDA